MRVLLAMSLVLVTGCGDPCDDVRDLTKSPAGIELTRSEHPAGWGNEQCFQCHQTWNIHQSRCVAVDNIDVPAINDRLIDVEDPEECMSCHGNNGVDRDIDTGGQSR